MLLPRLKLLLLLRPALLLLRPLDVVDAVIELLSDLCGHLLQKDLLSDVVERDVGRQLLNFFGEHCRSLAVSRDAVQEGVYFLFARTTISLPKIVKKLCLSVVRRRAREEGVDLWVFLGVEQLFQKREFVFDDGDVRPREGELDTANQDFDVVRVKWREIWSSKCLDLLGLIRQRRCDCRLRRQLRLSVPFLAVLLKGEFDSPCCDAFNILVSHWCRHPAC